MTRRQTPVRLVLALFALLAGLLAPVAQATEADAPPVREHGYIDTPDGERLKWTVIRPPGDGPFPVLMQYEGYNAGNNPMRANEVFAQEMLDDGYAILGVSLRGTACSSGVWDVFDPIYGLDGELAVEWAAEQPWSNGKVGLFSFSFAGIMTLLTAGNTPDGLVAAAPGMVVSDIYRDIAYPGGILNDVFPPVWGAALHATWAQAAPQAVKDGDTECLANIARHQVENLPLTVAKQDLEHPYDDEWMATRNPQRLLSNIDVPVLGMMAWQDEQTGPRGGLAFDQLDPRRTWTVGTNGQHSMYAGSPTWRAMLHRFFDRYLKGEGNGWERTPHVQLWHETRTSDSDPGWVSASNQRPFPTRTSVLHLQPGGLLAPPAPGPYGRSTSYAYPAPAPAVAGDSPNDQSNGYGLSWTASRPTPGGTAAFTTAPLTADLGVTGTASLDAWVTSTAPDADVQVTVTEVRPDGQEMYVQRGWLRLSHRAVDQARSTPTNPVHPHTPEAQRAVPAGTPVLARIATLPFTHVFREGSSLRIWLETPSTTGLWGFAHTTTPSTISVLHDAAHPSRLVLGAMQGVRPAQPLPACGSTRSQPCRENPVPVPGS